MKSIAQFFVLPNSGRLRKKMRTDGANQSITQSENIRHLLPTSFISLGESGQRITLLRLILYKIFPKLSKKVAQK
jgi:hypothetical protein